MPYLLILFVSFLQLNILAQKEQADTTHKEVDPFEEHHCFNEHDSFSLGVGIPFSFHFDTPGANLRGYYNVNHNICFGPELTMIRNSDVSIVDVDFVGHYIFETPWVGIYPVAGVNYTDERSTHEKQSAFGVVFGGGIHRNFKKFIIFSEYTHIESTLNDDFVTVGVLYTL